MASRNLDDLEPELKAKALEFLDRCRSKGADILIYCTLRTPHEQARLFRQSRSFNDIMLRAESLALYNPRMGEILFEVGAQHGRRVTNAGPGQSLHNYGFAFDCVPLLGGKAMWNSYFKDWQIVGEIAQELDLEWAGNWTYGREYPHVQIADRNWRTMIGDLA